MSVTAQLADGRTLKFPDGTDPGVVQATVKKMVTPPSTMEKAGQIPVLGGAVGASEALGALGTGALAAPIAGIAGLAQGAKNLVSPGMSAGDRVQQVQQALTYQPRTQPGKEIARVAAYPFEKLAQGADYVGGNVAEATGSPALGAGVNAALQMAPGVVAKVARPAVEDAFAAAKQRAADLKSINSVRDKTVNDARDLGYKFPQSEVQGSFLGDQVESVGGKAALAQQMNRHNQIVSNEVARREAGLAPDEPLSVDTLKAARERIAAPYREVTALSPAADEALKKVQAARIEAKDYWNEYGRTGVVEAKKKAQGFEQEARMQEGVIDMEASRLRVPGLLDRVKQARKELAKNYDVDSALNRGSGDVDANIWGRMLDRDKPLTGELRAAAAAAEALGRYTKDVSAVQSPGVSKLKPVASAGLALAGHAALGPIGWLAGVAPFLDAPARSLAMSGMMQRPRTYGPGGGISMLEAATANPAAYAGVPALGGILQSLQEQNR